MEKLKWIIILGILTLSVHAAEVVKIEGRRAILRSDDLRLFHNIGDIVSADNPKILKILKFKNNLVLIEVLDGDLSEGQQINPEPLKSTKPTVAKKRAANTFNEYKRHPFPPQESKYSKSVELNLLGGFTTPINVDGSSFI